MNPVSWASFGFDFIISMRFDANLFRAVVALSKGMAFGICAAEREARAGLVLVEAPISDIVKRKHIRSKG